MQRSWLCLYIVAVAAGCSGRPIPLASDGAATPDGLAETVVSDGGEQDSFCQGSTPKLIVNGSTVAGAYSPAHASSTGGGLYLSMQLRASEGAGIAYYFSIQAKQGATIPLTLDLGALPTPWQVSASKFYCSVGGTDACQILGLISSGSGDLFSGTVRVTGTSLKAMERVTICARGEAAQPPTHSPVMSFQLYMSERL